jgi:hypothetical protein
MYSGLSLIRDIETWDNFDGIFEVKDMMINSYYYDKL